MDDNVKLCPECEAEFFAHIAECNRCEVPLVSPEELRKGPLKKAEGELVVIMQGSLERMKEIAYGLKGKDIQSKILNAGEGGASCGGGNYGLFVDQSIGREAVEAAGEIYSKLYPEIEELEESYRKGECPACGANVKNAPGVCSDCGLNLGGF
jgi:predicted amidophosphoribosyltransferase